MADNQKQLEELNKKFHLLELRQQQIASDLQQIKKDLGALNTSQVEVAFPTLDKPVTTIDDIIESSIKTEKVTEGPGFIIGEPAQVLRPAQQRRREKTPIEEFIGTNLLNKIGIAVLVFGIGIGAKYAIDHDMISPLTRIVLGYLCGVILIALAVRLKPKYESFSAVLLSGGMAVLYFITFAAYDLYELIPRMMAFVLMLIFTAFTVFAALQYNLQVIAIIGLVGAYGVPFLLSDGSGKVAILFAYMSILNAGILLLSFKKTWKALYYTAFALTWLIFGAWMIDRYNANEHLLISLAFSAVFFITFYITLLSYKLLQKEPLARWDIILLMANSFLFYGFGYYAIDEHEQGDFFLGLFTVFNAVLHFMACYVIYKKQNATRDTFYFVAGLVLVFLTLAVPVQLEGNWVTLVWAGEAVLLFWIGRSKNFPVYERLSYVLILLTFFSWIQDLQSYYGHYYRGLDELFVPFFTNIQFLSSILVCMALAAIFKISINNKQENSNRIIQTFNWVLPALLLLTLYLSFYKEISNFWDQRYIDSEVTIMESEYSYGKFDVDLPRLQTIWLMIYSAFFITVLAMVNHRWAKNNYLSYFLSGFSALLLFNFITIGLSDLSYLRMSFVTQEDARFYFRNAGNILIRYGSFVAMIPLLVVIYRNMQAKEINDTLKKSERAFFHFVILALISSELINILDLSAIEDSDKLALSILWGAYALGLIIFGLVKEIKFVRILAIVLFGITLVKLFFYDLSSMGTIAKTIVMIVLGALLLVASFLYNKFKKTSEAETESNNS
jgi:uncharacterized membrane protein